MDLSRLAEPFDPSDIEWRPQGGISYDKVTVVPYIEARAVMQRLDDVCGPENWRVRYEHIAGGVMCCLEIRCGAGDEPGGDWVAKWDGSEESKIESFKGGISGSLKRAAVPWGIGRFLYRLPKFRVAARVPKKGDRTPRGWNWTKEFIYEVPTLPDWALPGGSGFPPESAPPPAPPPAQKPRERPRELLSAAQQARIGILRRETGTEDEAYYTVLRKRYGVESSKDLSPEQAADLIQRLEKRERDDLERQAENTFSVSERVLKLRASLRGLCEKLVGYGDKLKRGGKVDYRSYGLDIDSASEILELVDDMADEKELEGVIEKFGAVIEGEVF